MESLLELRGQLPAATNECPPLSSNQRLLATLPAAVPRGIHPVAALRLARQKKHLLASLNSGPFADMAEELVAYVTPGISGSDLFGLQSLCIHEAAHAATAHHLGVSASWEVWPIPTTAPESWPGWVGGTYLQGRSTAQGERLIALAGVVAEMLWQHPEASTRQVNQYIEHFGMTESDASAAGGYTSKDVCAAMDLVRLCMARILFDAGRFVRLYMPNPASAKGLPNANLENAKVPSTTDTGRRQTQARKSNSRGGRGTSGPGLGHDESPTSGGLPVEVQLGVEATPH